jgi:endonuclease G
MKTIIAIFSGMITLVAYPQSYELPSASTREQVVKHVGFTLSYSEGYELPSWVAWQITPEQASAQGEFRERFSADSAVATGTASQKDYKDAGFIIGQLAPPEDMFLNPVAVDETFLMSNTAPMKPAFQKYIWKNIEKLVREWAKEGHTLYLSAGPVLADAPFGTFGSNKVSIPTRFYKVVLDVHGERAIGFVVRSNVASGAPKAFALPVDEVEKITGLDFFTSLPDEMEQKIESSSDFGLWNFKAPEQ